MNEASSEAKGIYTAPWERQFDRVLSPFEHFVNRQSASGLLLMASAVLALIIANSALATIYEGVLHTHFSVSLGSWSIDKTLHHWVNDGLMAFFFFVVGLELKREMLVGELANIRKAALPAIAALGGMIVPAAIYWFFNKSGEGHHGWGIPMATDIAFAVGVLVLLASRIPRALIAFLVALAIVDDLGAVVVIAIFYTSELNMQALAAVGLITLLLFGLNMGGVRRSLPYFLLAVPLWYAMLLSGVHASIAGVIGAFTVPARPKFNPAHYRERTHDLLATFERSYQENSNIYSNDELRSVVRSIERNAHKVMTPLQRLEYIWHLPVAFLIIPIFAIFNAGVEIDLSRWHDMATNPVLLGTVLGLVVGKFIGIFAFSWAAVKIGIAALPDGVLFRHIAGAALVAGIGFTMSIFIAELSFPGHEELLLLAKTGILLASILSGIVGLLWLWLVDKWK